MRLFEMVDWNVVISPEAYMLKPFKKVIAADKTKTKIKALKELAFMWFYADIRSDYNYILNVDLKIEEIRKDLELPPKWKMSKDLYAAIDFYKERSKTISSAILDDSIFIAGTLSTKMRQSVEDEDLTISEMEKVAKNINQMSSIVSTLQKLETTVLKEQAEKVDKVGSQTKALYEDGI